MRIFTLLLLATTALAPASGQSTKDVDITTPDGARLRGTFYAAAKPGPAVILLHMCNTDRRSWSPVAQQLAANGINALTIDNRGFGESSGSNYGKATAEERRETIKRWPGDFDAAYAFLLAQPGVEKNHIAAGGGSCGVNNAVQLAMRHPEIQTLALLAGETDPAGISYLVDHPQIALFTAAAADDQYYSAAPQLMKWIRDLSSNARSEFVGFANGKHGTEIFGPHPELVSDIVQFFTGALEPGPARPPGSLQNSAASEFWKTARTSGGAARAAQMYRDDRKRDSTAYLPEPLVNTLGYTRLQADDAHAKEDGLELLKLNTEIYPNSANAFDSLSDAYLALGKKDLALQAERKCLDLLPADRSEAEFKADLKKHAEEKVAELERQAK